ncbi:hypothetical protein NPIL_692771 [Nephila pilipes]|uniref:Uncharacterized protein n=1 Tax=Nephila pilipes TaxID=299642 RepID=A0A8X6Q981_NEPPI|nr:hypothetical protein NPIL_692771 [Nephila pilipes]
MGANASPAHRGVTTRTGGCAVAPAAHRRAATPAHTPAVLHRLLSCRSSPAYLLPLPVPCALPCNAYLQRCHTITQHCCRRNATCVCKATTRAFCYLLFSPL